MAKLTPNYLITACLTIVAACLGGFITQRQPQVAFDANLNALPMIIGDWRGHDIELDTGTRDKLSADRILFRYYTNSKTQRQVCLLIVYRKYGRREFVHRPELCFPAAGWEIRSTGYSLVPYLRHNVQVRYVEAEKSGSGALSTYWFASGRRTEANYVKQQMRMALDRLQRQRYGWAFLRVDVPMPHGREEAHDLTRAFMKGIEKPLTKTLMTNE